MKFPSRGALFDRAASSLASWSVRLLVIVAAAAVGLWLVGMLWTIVLPIIIAVVICTVLWPPTALLRRWLPASLSALLVLIFSGLVVGGVIAAIAPSIVSQSTELADQATAGVRKIQDWAHGPPFNINDEQISTFTDSIIEKLQGSADSIASGVFSGVSAAGSAAVTAGLVLVLVFLFLKDGNRFAPWAGKMLGQPAGPHAVAILQRMWTTLGGFIRTQAIVSFIDALFIGLGLVLLDVPLAYALAVITFVGGFVPIVGALVAGALAVLIALVANGFGTALAVLAIVIAVQQLEGNVLSPWLQGRSMQLHATVILLAVGFGGTQFGIIGAFLAVPAAACAAVALRYANEQIAERVSAEDPSDYEPSADHTSTDEPAMEKTDNSGPADPPGAAVAGA